MASRQEPARELLDVLGLPPTPASAAAGRHALAAVLVGVVDGDAHDVVMLLASELIANAVIHGEPPITLSATLSPRCLRVAVADASDTLPARRDPGYQPSGGWGVRLVSELASRWGAEPTAAGKQVWFELDRPSPSPIG